MSLVSILARAASPNPWRSSDTFPFPAWRHSLSSEGHRQAGSGDCHRADMNAVQSWKGLQPSGKAGDSFSEKTVDQRSLGGVVSPDAQSSTRSCISSESSWTWVLELGGRIPGHPSSLPLSSYTALSQQWATLGLDFLPAKLRQWYSPACRASVKD